MKAPSLGPFEPENHKRYEIHFFRPLKDSTSMPPGRLYYSRKSRILSSARSASLRYITWYHIKHGGCSLTTLQILYSLGAHNLEQIQVFFLILKPGPGAKNSKDDCFRRLFFFLIYYIVYILRLSFARKKPFVIWSGTKGNQLKKNILLWWHVFKKLFVLFLSSALGKTIKRTVGKQKKTISFNLTKLVSCR